MSEEQVTQQPDAEQAESKTTTPLDEFVAHQKRAIEETSKAIESLLPPGFVGTSTMRGNAAGNSGRASVGPNAGT